MRILAAGEPIREVLGLTAHNKGGWKTVSSPTVCFVWPHRFRQNTTLHSILKFSTPQTPRSGRQKTG
jgi:hypothetical protein